MANDIMSALSKKTQTKVNPTVQGLTEMFGLTDNFQITDLPISKLLENANHPFKITDNDEMMLLAESIINDGLLEPIIVRPRENGFYEILAGHRRTRAHEIKGLPTIKAIVVSVDDEKANRILINTNFKQRSTIYPSEIAKSYKLRYEDLKKSRKNSDHRNFETEKKIDEILAEEFKMSKSSIYMYLHFNNLIPSLLDMLDAKKIKFKIADELSYLRESEQQFIYEIVYADKLCSLDQKLASTLRKESSENEQSREDIIALLTSQKRKTTKYKFFSEGQLDKYSNKFGSPEDMERAIIEFLESY